MTSFTKDNANDGYLTGQILLAMPNMTDPRFSKAAIYMCVHDEKGAMGLVINNIMPGVEFGSLLKDLNIGSDLKIASNIVTKPVINGGPVETARGFLLHSSDFQHADTVNLSNNLCLTGTIEALRDVAVGKGPEAMVFALGYSGWGAGQLDQEIQQNTWLSCQASEDLIFGTPSDKIWDKALDSLGVSPALLSGTAGRA